MQFSKRNFSLSSRSNYRPIIGFVLQPSHGREALRIELSPFQLSDSTIRVTDSHGHTLMESDQPAEDSQACLEYTIKDLKTGIYYFEVSDGFYYQVKEVRFSAA